MCFSGVRFRVSGIRSQGLLSCYRELLLNTVLLFVSVVLIGLQRLLELRYSHRNERRLRARGAVERGAGHYPFMVAIHALWLASTLFEGLLRGPAFPSWWPVPLVVFLLAQPLRYWAIVSLGGNWNVKILVVPGTKPVRRGPYGYFPHPNYVAVVMEVLAFPLIFGAWITALAFSALNAAFLFVRVREEERTLRELAG